MKISTLIMFLIVVVTVSVVVADLTERRHRRKFHEEREKELNKEAYETIQDAKTWIKTAEENNITMEDIRNEHSLRDLVSLEPAEEDYEKFLEILTGRIKELYEGYQFSLFEPAEGDLLSGYFMQFQILGQESLHNDLFVLAMDKGIDMDILNDLFYEELAKGAIFELGEKIEVERDGTGISPVTTGDDIRIIVSFVTDEYKALQEADKKE